MMWMVVGFVVRTMMVDDEPFVSAKYTARGDTTLVTVSITGFIGVNLLFGFTMTARCGVSGYISNTRVRHN